MSNAGIDYGLGRTNIDVVTGIRYGVISSHTVGQAWYEDAEADYGDPHCPDCGNEAASTDKLEDDDREDYDCAQGACGDYACHNCKTLFDAEDAFGDEPVGYSYDRDGYKLASCLDSDVMVLASPFYTLALYCSPCVPGAGNLDCASEDGIKAYCLGHEWFEDGKAPYRVFKVEDDTEVLANG